LTLDKESFADIMLLKGYEEEREETSNGNMRIPRN